MRRVLWFGVSLGVGALLASAMPDIKRYLRIVRM
jgi:uncharacterized protein DUF6893